MVGGQIIAKLLELETNTFEFHDSSRVKLFKFANL